MPLELLVGSARFRLEEEEAWDLVHRIRARCVDDDHRPLNADALRCLQLADVLADNLESVDRPAPIGLDQAHARALTDHILTPSLMVTDELRALSDALVRFR